MSVVCQEYGKVGVVTLNGDLVGDESAVVRQSVTDFMARQQLFDFILDFQGCGFVDSQGLETMLWLKSKADELFGCVKLINLDENVLKILEITRLYPKFECTQDLASALKMMG